MSSSRPCSRLHHISSSSANSAWRPRTTLQRTSSLSCAATPLPQTFATGRFYRTSSCANQMTGNARKTRHCRSSSSTFGTPKNTVHAPYTPHTFRHDHRVQDQHRKQPLSRYSTNQRSGRAFTVQLVVGSTSRRKQTSSPREAQPPRATAAPACPRTARLAFRWQTEPDETAPRRALHNQPTQSST